MNKKIIAVREYFGMNQTEFAAVLGISQPTYSRMEKGQTPLSEEEMNILFIAKEISPLWYFYDAGPMFFAEKERNARAFNTAKIMADHDDAKWYFYHQIMCDHYKDKIKEMAGE